jgi:hypothetical protein
MGRWPPAPLDLREPLAVREKIDLVQGDDLGPPEEPSIVGGEFVADRLVVRAEIASLEQPGAGVEQVHQNPSPLHVTQEAVAQPRPLARPCDETRDVGHYEVALAPLGDPQRRDQRGEGVGGDGRPCGGDGAQQGGLSGVGQTDQPHVGQQLQQEPHTPGLAAAPGFREVGSLTRGQGIARIAAPPTPPPRGHEALAGLREVGQRGGVGGYLGVAHHCAHRNPNLDVSAAASVAAASRAV